MILAIDATHLLRTLYEFAKRSETHEATDAIDMFTSRLDKLSEAFAKQGIEYSICVFDNDHETFRHWIAEADMVGGYKEGREVESMSRWWPCLDLQELQDRYGIRPAEANL